MGQFAGAQVAFDQLAVDALDARSTGALEWRLLDDQSDEINGILADDSLNLEVSHESNRYITDFDPSKSL